MLNTPESERISFSQWAQGDEQPLAPDYQLLQAALLWQAAEAEANTVSDAEAQTGLQAVYQRLGVHQPPVTSQPSSIPQATWWERLAHWAQQPAWQLGFATLFVGLVAVTLWRLQTAPTPVLIADTGQVITRSVTPSTQPVAIAPAPVYELRVADVANEAAQLQANLPAYAFVVEQMRPLNQDEMLLTIRAPSAPLDKQRLQFLQDHHLQQWLNTPNARIELHLKPRQP